MGLMLSKSELAQTEPAERAAFRSPVPTQIVSNGEFNPLPQTAQQRRVEERVKEIADAIAPRLGLDRRQFLRTGCGMAAAFLAMNDVFGSLFVIDRRRRRSRGRRQNGSTAWRVSSSSTTKCTSFGTTTRGRGSSGSRNTRRSTGTRTCSRMRG